MTTTDLKRYLAVATQAALEGGEVLRHYWGKIQHVQHKVDSGDLVTEADRESEERIFAILQEECPDHDFLGEESGLQRKQNGEFLWAVDPLDGTTNYTHGYPFVAVSVGLVHQGRPIVGVVYNPILNELFQAAQGQGATLNGETIHVSDASSLNKSLLATGFAYDRQRNPDTNYAEFCHITHISQGVRRAGSAAIDLSYVASGRLEGYWEQGIKTWDIAAGAIIVEEAGGKITDYDQGDLDVYSGRILATNGQIHDQLCQEIVKIRNSR